MVVELAIGAALLAAMLCVSWYGWVTLPADAQVPIHFGPGAYNQFVPKRAGLIMHPAAGVVVFIILVVVSRGAGAKAPAAPKFLPVVMAVLLVTQAGAIWVARKRSAS
jgi:heme A synthase